MSAPKLELCVGPSLDGMEVCNVEGKMVQLLMGFTDISIMATMIKVS